MYVYNYAYYVSIAYPDMHAYAMHKYTNAHVHTYLIYLYLREYIQPNADSQTT